LQVDLSSSEIDQSFTKHVDAGSNCFKTGVQFSTSPPIHNLT